MSRAGFVLAGLLLDTVLVAVCLSAELSATMQSAQVAAKAIDGDTPIEIIDSLSASMGIGNLALHVVDLPECLARLGCSRVGRGIQERAQESVRNLLARHEFLRGDCRPGARADDGRLDAQPVPPGRLRRRGLQPGSP